MLLADADVYRFEPTRRVPWLPVALIGALAAALLSTCIPVVSRILAQPDGLWRLTAPQIFRVVGVTFVVVMALGKLPAVFALPAGLGDIAIGVEAAFVARNLRRGVLGRGAVWFNVFGLVDLVVALGIGFAAAPAAVRLLFVTPTTEAISLLPLALIPATIVHAGDGTAPGVVAQAQSRPGHGNGHHACWEHEMTRTIPHLVNRFLIDTDKTFDEVRQRYESLVPTIDFAELTAVIEAGDLVRVQRYTAEHAPHSFVNFWTFDPMPMMHLAGHRTRAITYMMGNNVIVETMFRHDPGVLLYAPLRTEIYQDTAGRVHFSIDQPSSKFASFGDPRITEVGLRLDVKLAALLRLAGLPVPTELEPL